MSSTYSIGFMNQVADALEKAGFTTDLLTSFIQKKDLLRQFIDVLTGKAEIKYPEHLIDCDADPFIPEGWSVEEHKRGWLRKWTANQISLYLSKKQKNDAIGGHELRKELVSQSVLNANVLDFLLAHPELIPEEWKGIYIYFWGTIYRNADGNLYVRHLYWHDGLWDWDYHWLDVDFSDSSQAAVFVSKAL